MAQEHTYPDLKIGTDHRQILSIALPISFAIFIPQINFITNNIFLGQLGETALAAAGITGVYYLIFAVIGFGLNNGLQALIARRAGQDRIGEIGKLFAQGVYVSLFFAAFSILITYTLAPQLLRHALQSKALTEQCLDFLYIRIWGLPFLYIYQMRNALLVGTNQSKLLIWGTLAETGTNILMDYSLIYGHFGFPRMGFNGAAIASILAEFMGIFVVFLVIEIKGISKQFSLYRQVRLNLADCRLILQQSAPLIFQYVISIVSWEFFYIQIEHYGSRDLAISNTMRNIFGMFGVFTWAFAATATTMVSNLIGQNRAEEVLALIWKIARLSILITIGCCLVLNIFAAEFLYIYGQGDAFVQAAIPVMRVVTVGLVLMSFANVWLNAIAGTGNPRINLAFEVMAILVYCIYVFYVLKIYKLSIVVGWTSEWVYWSILFVLSVLYMRSNRWKGKII